MADQARQNFVLEPLSGADKATSDPHAVILRTGNARDLNLAKRTLRALDRQTVRARMTKQADRIDRLVEALIDEEPVSELEERLEIDNAALRAEYLETVPSFGAADLHQMAGSKAANKSALAGRWKEAGRVFALPYKGVDRFPAFQFSDGQPRPVVKRVLAALAPAQLSPWQTAFWFASGNGWLEDAAPQDCLDDIAAVIAAAEHAAEPTIG